jgi:hypothetical protein
LGSNEETGHRMALVEIYTALGLRKIPTVPHEIQPDSNPAHSQLPQPARHMKRYSLASGLKERTETLGCPALRVYLVAGYAACRAMNEGRSIYSSSQPTPGVLRDSTCSRAREIIMRTITLAALRHCRSIVCDDPSRIEVAFWPAYEIVVSRFDAAATAGLRLWD